MTVRSDTLAAVDGEWRSAREVHRRMGIWSKTTIHHQLRLLAIAGDVDEMRLPYPGGAARSRSSAQSQYEEDSQMRCTVSGQQPTNPINAPVPNEATRADGQHVDHWVLCAEERAKGFVRPLRLKYQHVGRPGPKHELRELTAEERARYPFEEYRYVKFEDYPESRRPITGRFWTYEDIHRIGAGCNVVTSMPIACAETYARQPDYYGSTFCCGCGKYLPVGADGEFIWDDGTDERVGT